MSKPNQSTITLLQEMRWVNRYIIEKLDLIVRKENVIMAKQEELDQRVTDLTNAIAAEHAQVAEAIEALEAAVQALKDAAAAQEPLDFTAMDAAIASVGAIFEPPPTP